MRTCRICGKKYSESINAGLEICSNSGCWKRAWREAVKPFKKVPRTARGKNLTSAEKEAICKMYRDGIKRDKIAKATGRSYATVAKVIREDSGSEYSLI